MQIFLSFAGEYRELADRLAVGLAQEGHRVFFDRDDLPPGEGYDAAIRRELDRADLLIFLITPESIRDGAYALSELTDLRQRWRNPSGRVLPVMVEPVPFDDIPGYLSAVTVLQSRANLVADVLAAVEELAHRRARPRPVWGLLAGAAVAIVALVWFWGRDDAAAAPVCYLWIEPTAGSRIGRIDALRLTLDVQVAGKTDSFILTGSGRTPFQIEVGRGDSWTLRLVDWQGNAVGSREIRGCPQASMEVVIDEHVQMVVRPRIP